MRLRGEGGIWDQDTFRHGHTWGCNVDGYSMIGQISPATISTFRSRSLDVSPDSRLPYDASIGLRRCCCHAYLIPSHSTSTDTLGSIMALSKVSGIVSTAISLGR